MSFAKEMADTKARLEAIGHSVFAPRNLQDFLDGTPSSEKKALKIQHDVIRDYFHEIQGSDAVLVLNYLKRGIEGYVGANALIEMAFAHVLGKKIYLMNSIPVMDYSDEIEVMSPAVLNGDISNLA